MADKFDEFLEEVESDIRQEKYLTLWKRYGKFVIGVVVAILLVVAGCVLWQNYEKKQRTRLAEQFIEAQDSLANGQTTHALQLLENMAKNSHKIYAALARFLDAGVLAQEGSPENLKKAIEAVQALSEDTHLEQAWRDLASILFVSISLDLNEGVDMDKLLTRLVPLTVSTNSWHYLASELKGLILSQKGEAAPAAEVFVSLVQDPNTPDGIKSRAQLMAQVITAELGTSGH